eukprot:scaffold284378_cov31-Tisochrysis_lutea.AAC.3
MRAQTARVRLVEPQPREVLLYDDRQEADGGSFADFAREYMRRDQPMVDRTRRDAHVDTEDDVSTPRLGSHLKLQDGKRRVCERRRADHPALLLKDRPQRVHRVLN